MARKMENQLTVALQTGRKVHLFWHLKGSGGESGGEEYYKIIMQLLCKREA